MNLIELNNCFIADQLQLEEKLLREESEEFCIINTGSSPAIVMGISGKAETLIHQEQNVLPILRRFSGGGTVVIDENTVFITFICNKISHPFPAYPEPILRWAESLLSPVTPGLKLRENDFVIGEKKCGGNALYIKKDRWLIHTSFLWDYDPSKMALLKYPPKTPTYREGRSHEEFICRLSEFIPDQTEWLEKIKNSVSSQDLSVRP